MPHTEKGKKIKTAMKSIYGSKKDERVFYAYASKGAIMGVHKKKKTLPKPQHTPKKY